MLDPHWKLVSEDPYDLRLTYKGHTVATFSLDDAPLPDWNSGVKYIADVIVEKLEKVDYSNYMGF